MKHLLFILFIIIGYSANAQDGFFLTKQQHEQIKANLRDYKVLIIKYEVRSKEFEDLKAQYAFTKNLYVNLQSENEILRLKSINAHNLEIKIQNLENDKLKMAEKISSQQRELEYKNKSLYNYQRKYFKERSTNRGDRLMAAVVYGSFMLAGIWGVYISIEANH